MRHALLATALLASGGAFAADAPPPRTFVVSAIATVDATGHVAKLEWRGGDALQALTLPRLEPVVKAWTFVPASIDGVPAETRTVLSVAMRAQADAGGGLELFVLGAKTGASDAKLTAPRFPSAALRAGDDARVTLELAVNADGTATVADAEIEATGSKSAFLAAAREAAKQWRFIPETVGGHAVPATLSVPVTFCVTNKQPWCANGGGAMTPVPADSALTFATPVVEQRI